MMGLQPPRGVTWEEVAHGFLFKNLCDVCYFSLCLITLQPFLSCLVFGGSHIRNSLWRHTLQGDACVTNSCMPRTSSDVYIGALLLTSTVLSFHPFTNATGIRVSVTYSCNEVAYILLALLQ